MADPKPIGIGSRYEAMKRILERRGAKAHEMKNLALWAGRRRKKPKKARPETVRPPEE